MLCVSTSVLVMFAGVAGGAVWNRWAMHTADYATYGKAMFDLPEDSRLGCENAFGESVPRECDFGSATPSKTIVLFGDSHAEQWLPAFHEIADRKNWKIALFVKSSCPALAISISAAQAAGEDVWCRKWRELAIERIRQLHPAAVVLSNATEYKEINRPQVFQSRDEWRVGARKTFSAFKKDEFPLVFIRDTPWARYDVTRCLARAAWNKNNHPCASLVRRAALNDDVYRAEIGGSEGVRPVSFIDLSDVICGPTSCNLTQGDTIIYRDSSHLTATYLRSLSNNLYDQLVRAVPALAR